MADNKYTSDFSDYSNNMNNIPSNEEVKEKPYYEMKYQKDGNFSNDFGKGFFDEASNLAFEIL